MSDVQITIALPEELMDRVKAAGLTIESIAPDGIAVFEQRLSCKEECQSLVDTAHRLQGSDSFFGDLLWMHRFQLLKCAIRIAARASAMTVRAASQSFAIRVVLHSHGMLTLW